MYACAHVCVCVHPPHTHEFISNQEMHGLKHLVSFKKILPFLIVISCKEGIVSPKW